MDMEEDVVVEDMETDSGETVEHKLRRLLHIGSTGASVQLQGGFKRSVVERMRVVFVALVELNC